MARSAMSTKGVRIELPCRVGSLCEDLRKQIRRNCVAGICVRRDLGKGVEYKPLRSLCGAPKTGVEMIREGTCLISSKGTKSGVEVGISNSARVGRTRDSLRGRVYYKIPSAICLDGCTKHALKHIVHSKVAGKLLCLNVCGANVRHKVSKKPLSSLPPALREHARRLKSMS